MLTISLGLDLLEMAENSMFRSAFKRTRCLIPATGYSVSGEIATLRKPLPQPQADLTLSTTDKSTYTIKLSEALARTREAFKYAWRRMVEMIVNFQKDMKSLVS